MRKKKVKYKFTKTFPTVADFKEIADTIDCNPVHQRRSRDDAAFSKSQNIIFTMVCGVDIGQITIHKTPKGKFSYESIDGGHRKRAIIAFLANKFAVKGYDGTLKYWREFTEEERELFNSITLTFCVYENLTGAQVGYIFRVLNTTTKIEHQEMLNSYGDIPIANVVRETTRVIASVGNDIHSLFETVKKRKKIVYTYWHNFSNDGFNQDEWVARLFYRYLSGGGNGEADISHLAEMYDNQKIDNNLAQELKKKVHELLRFVQRMSVQSKEINGRGLNLSEANVFSRLYLHLESLHGKSWKIEDDDIFFKKVNTAHKQLTDSDTKDPELLAISPFDSGRALWSQYKAMMTRYKDNVAIEHALGMLLNRIDLPNIITVLDKKRAAGRAVSERLLAFQNYKNPVTGELLTMKNAHADHIIPHSKGGKSVPANFQMISAKQNLAKGTKSNEEFFGSLESIDKE